MKGVRQAEHEARLAERENVHTIRVGMLRGKNNLGDFCLYSDNIKTCL